LIKSTETSSVKSQLKIIMTGEPSKESNGNAHPRYINYWNDTLQINVNMYRVFLFNLSIVYSHFQECRPPINHKIQDKIQDKIHKIFAPLKFTLSKKWSDQDASLPAMFSTVQTL